MVDIHSHILWQLDDGSRSFDESVAMLRAAEMAGTTDIVATPHANPHYRFDPACVAERIQALRDVPDLKIRIHQGCDFHLMYENIVDALANPSKYSINGGPYILAELPDFNVPPSLDTALERLVAADLVPVITHPERNPVICKNIDRLARWVDLGCLVQVTGGSLTGLFGRSAKRAADELFRRRLVHVIASDAHDLNVRHPRLDDARAAVASGYGEALAQRLFEEIPGAIIAGRPVDTYIDDREQPRNRRWWPFASRGR